MIIENQKARWFVIVLVLGLSLFWSLPSFLNLDRDSEWPTKDRLNYGLDIQGGLHLVMGVDTQSVIAESTQRLARSLKDDLKDNNVLIGDTKVINPNVGELSLDIGEASKEAVLKFLSDDYATTLQVLNDSNNQIVVRYYETYLRDYNKRVIDQAIETIRNRIDEFGVSEPSITAQGSSRILVQLPGIEDASSAKKLINTAARLEFMIVSKDATPEQLQDWISEAEKTGNYTLEELSYSSYIKRLNQDLQPKLPKNTVLYFEKSQNAKTIAMGRVPYLLQTDTDLGGSDLEDAFVGFNEFGAPIVSLKFTPLGGKKFADLTGKNVNRLMAIVLDRVVKSAPNIEGRIGGGSAQITLGRQQNQNDTLNEAKTISMALRAGALPASLEQLEERTVGPTLGKDSIDRAKLAGLVSGLFVLLFMLFWYKGFGVVASLALGFNIVMLVAVLTSLGATLTLPGVAGIVLTIGMAVDANVIIFERIKEELKKGASLQLSIKEGYSRAFSAIFDANITTAIVCLVLMYFGTGPIRGFAVTLIIGIITSMFTAIFFTRALLDLLVIHFKIKKLPI